MAGATALIGGRRVRGDTWWRRWLHRRREERRELREEYGVKEGGKTKVLEGEEERSLGVVAPRSEEEEEEDVVIYMVMITQKA